jgi:hypothetical protein
MPEKIEVLRRIEKFDNGDARWLCCECECKYTGASLYKGLLHLNTVHGIDEVEIEIAEGKVFKID